MHATVLMTHLFKLAACLTLAACMTAQPQSHAQEPNKGYAQHPQAQEMADQLAKDRGIPKSVTLEILGQAQYMQGVVNAIRPPKSPTVKNWDTYRARFVEPIRIRKGLKFWDENAQSLQEAEQLYGVPQEVIVAIIGVETIYGEHIGNYRVIDALATLGFDFPAGQKDRSAFFRSELASFIELCQNSHLNALVVKGSYAGAIGLGQFMPSSWQNFAVDGDKDGVIDLFNSRKDAIYSVANFLKVHGWTPNASGVVPITLRDHVDLPTLLAPDILPTFTPDQLQKLGVDLLRPVRSEEKLALIELVRGEKPSTHVAGGQNFYAVTRYNRSSFYAGAVLGLAEALRDKRLKGQ